MNLLLTVLEIVAPVFLLALIGFVWVKHGFEYQVEFVTRLAMTLSVPCLIFVALMKADIDRSALAVTFLASCVAYLVVTVVFALIVRLFKLEMRTFLAPLIFGNTGNLGLPLALFAFGEVGLSYAIIIFAVMAVYSFSVGVWLVSGGGSLIKIVKEPLVGATLLGALFLYNGWETPTFLTNALELIGQMAIPIMLITLGVALARLKPDSFGRAIVLSVVKVALCTGIAWGVGLYFALEPVALAVLVMQIATPVAVTSYLLAEKYGADANEVAGLVVVSTLLSVITIPLTLAFFV
ncbi:AEC family transporter [Amylibacter sp. SFDW26]|uniref:AEC family transporter n=1 Tax=Amylibacter sp. SFDW26 TaxID=2652722 RepID=UPI001262A868|nr:AEC family transporter [Amylibacter sp. SFDW26]KAB7614494.1 AEC family transporter [Amylibacter sp. SFDW26]